MLACCSISLTQVIWPIKKLEFTPSIWPQATQWLLHKMQSKKVACKRNKGFTYIDIVSIKKGQVALCQRQDYGVKHQAKYKLWCYLVYGTTNISPQNRKGTPAKCLAPLREWNVTSEKEPSMVVPVNSSHPMGYQAMQLIRTVIQSLCNRDRSFKENIQK